MSKRMNWQRSAERERIAKYGTEETGSGSKDQDARWTHLKPLPCYRVLKDGSRVLIDPKRDFTHASDSDAASRERYEAALNGRRPAAWAMRRRG